LGYASANVAEPHLCVTSSDVNKDLGQVTGYQLVIRQKGCLKWSLNPLSVSVDLPMRMPLKQNVAMSTNGLQLALTFCQYFI